MSQETRDEPKPMTKEEASVLLYLETCAVDHGGMVDARLDGRSRTIASTESAPRWQRLPMSKRRLMVKIIRGLVKIADNLLDGKTWNGKEEGPGG